MKQVLIYLVYPIMGAVPFLVLGSCISIPETKDSVSNGRYSARATVKTEGMSTTVMEIYGKETAFESSGGRKIITLINLAHEAKLKILPDDILFATAFADWSYKLYFLVKLDSPPAGEFRARAKSRWEDGPVLSSCRSDSVDVFLTSVKRQIGTFHLSLQMPLPAAEIFIMGAREVRLNSCDNQTLSIDVHWRSGEITEGLVLRLPDDPLGSIEAVCGQEAEIE